MFFKLFIRALRQLRFTFEEKRVNIHPVQDELQMPHNDNYLSRNKEFVIFLDGVDGQCFFACYFMRKSLLER